MTHRWLAERAMSVDDFENYLLRAVAARRLKAKLTADKIEAYFVEHRPAFDAARISRLATADEATARDIAARLVAGKASLAELSGSFPADSAQAPADAAGFSLRLHMDPALATAVFRASPGQLLGPLRNAQGAWELVQVHELRRAQLDAHTAALVGDLVFSHWLRGEVERRGVEFVLPAAIGAV